MCIKTPHYTRQARITGPQMREGELTAVRCQMQPLVEPVYRMQDVEPFPRRIKDDISDAEYAELVKQKSYLQHMHRRSGINS